MTDSNTTRPTYQNKTQDIFDLLKDIASAASSSRKDFYTSLSRILDKVISIFEVESGTVYLLEEKTLVFKVVSGHLKDMLEGQKISVGKGIAGFVASNKRFYYTNNVHTDSIWASDFNNALGELTQSILCFPIVFDDRAIGVIQLINKVGEGFNETDIDMLDSLCNHLAIAIENENLFTSYQKKISELDNFLKTAASLNSTLDIETLQQRAVDAIVSNTDSEGGSILMGDDTGGLFFKEAHGSKSNDIKNVKLDPGEGFAGWVAFNELPVLCNNPREDERFSNKADTATGFVTNNIIAVPIFDNESLIGIIEAVNKKDDRNYTNEDLEKAKTIANQVGLSHENIRLYADQKKLFLGTTMALAESIELRDKYTGGHTRRVTYYSVFIAGKLNLGADDIEKVRLSAILHDIGKIAIDDQILNKPGKLTKEEYDRIKAHPQIGFDLLSNIPDFYDEILPGILHHHERWDGKGYPKGFKEEECPLLGRIIAVADAFDAMTSTRIYHEDRTQQEKYIRALEELKKNKSAQFDPVLVDFFVDALEAGELAIHVE